jgi:hypothetical protein
MTAIRTVAGGGLPVRGGLRRHADGGGANVSVRIVRM